MKLIIASTIVPFMEGGDTFIVDWLELKLKEYGHQVAVVKIPYSSHYKQMLSQMLALRLYHLENACDRLICIRMPAYLIPHPDKYLWFIHHYREIYDLWETELDSLPKDAEMMAIREYIMRADDAAFAESKKIYTNSKIVSKRLWDYNSVKSDVLYPPVLQPEQFFCDCYGDYLYYPSRICQLKRQLLAVEAMRYTKTDVKLMISGKADNPLYMDKIEGEIKSHGLTKKIIIENRWISEQEKSKLFSKCLAALYIPFDENSYGYPSLEAHHSRKAVVACTDSGGTSELINDGENGFLVSPSPQALAAVFDRLYQDRHLAERMGNAGFERLTKLGIDWDTVIGGLTQ